MISAAAAQNAVISDILDALQDDQLSDLILVGCDGIEVEANRFVLAARSKVLKRMLYGNFREASCAKVKLHFDAIILEAIVEFCCKNEIPKFRVYIHRNARSARRLVQLFKAADFLELEGLAKLVAQMVHNLTSRFPPLACAVYDEADLDTQVSKDALLMIQCRPYVTLPPDNETGGGIDCLKDLKLLTIFVDNDVKASELFLFQMLKEWHQLTDHADSQEIAEQCATHLFLENIEPQDLLGDVRESGFCTEKSITDAITRQALRASQNHIWTLSSRGKPKIERIVVEGAGSQDANGIYYYIHGLENGELYSKREVACGQQHVYTLSISDAGEGTTECRIFCSNLLTNRSVNMLARRENSGDSSFSPLLQIIRIDDECIPDTSSTAQGSLAKGSNKYVKLQLSDGDHFIEGRIKASYSGNEIAPNCLIKVLEYATYVHDGNVAIHLKKISIVNHDPGKKFGNPVFFFDVFDGDSEDDGQSIVPDGTPIEVRLGQELMQRNASKSSNKGDDGKLRELYSCRFTAQEKPIHSKIPISGWKIDSNGLMPVPKVRWVPENESLNSKEK